MLRIYINCLISCVFEGINILVCRVEYWILRGVPCWVMGTSWFAASRRRLRNTGLDNVGPSTSHNPVGLHGLLQGELYFYLLLCYLRVFTDSPRELSVSIPTASLASWAPGVPRECKRISFSVLRGFCATSTSERKIPCISRGPSLQWTNHRLTILHEGNGKMRSA
jgi:hypothetical protein